MAVQRILIILGLVAGCGAAGPSDVPGADGGAPGDANPLVDAALSPDATTAQCPATGAICLSHDTRRFCSGGNWQDQSCPVGQGCVQGECVVAQCSDACNLGDVDGLKTCEIFDIANGTWGASSPDASTHDRSREYQRWLRRDAMAYGGIGNAIYSDPPNYTDVIRLRGLHDSAIWTGTYLAAEALRLSATGSADARANIKRVIDTLHLWFNVSGAPGVLSRFVTPASGTFPAVLEGANCGDEVVKCNVPFEGQQYNYMGHISRDQYQGVMLGYALAYDALGPTDEAARELIRADVVELVEELMKDRVVRARITLNGTTLGPFDINMRFVVLNPAEMTDGAVDLTVDTNDTDNSEMYGFQEFAPNIAHILRQFPGLGFLPDAPRAGSAIMLASFFQVALRVTENVPAYASRRAAIANYYTSNSGEGGNINDWLSIAGLWSYGGGCGDSYYANNIVMEPMYNLARLESDPGRLATIRGSILHDRMWAEFATTKNSFFSFIYAANTPGAASSITTEAATQLNGFPPPPRVRTAVNLMSNPAYQPHEAGCSNQTSHGGAVNVSERVTSDFIWQRHPWGLLDGGNPAVTYPGVDYLVAYWLGRHHGYIADDTSGRCTAWR